MLRICVTRGDGGGYDARVHGLSLARATFVIPVPLL